MGLSQEGRGPVGAAAHGRWLRWPAGPQRLGVGAHGVDPDDPARGRLPHNVEYRPPLDAPAI